MFLSVLQILRPRLRFKGARVRLADVTFSAQDLSFRLSSEN